MAGGITGERVAWWGRGNPYRYRKLVEEEGTVHSEWKIARGAGPARLKAASEVWYHVTRKDLVPVLLEQGLDPWPEELMGWGEAALVSFGGIYITSGARLAETYHMYGGGKRRELTALSLRLLKGTRFCLDEDDVIDKGDVWWLEERVRNWRAAGARVEDEPHMWGVPVELLVRAKRDMEKHPSARAEKAYRERLDRWTCVLAKALDQREIERWNLRVFDPPEIFDVA